MLAHARRLPWLAAPLLALCTAAGASAVEVSGLSTSVQVLTDSDGVRHIEAANDLDSARAQGYVHCQDRLFQMDLTRRQISGDLAELVGGSAIGSDIQNRTIGLRRAAQRSFDAAPAVFQAQLQAYADGVNHCIATLPLPVEYSILELTQVRPWSPIDSLTIGKGISASLSLDIDIDLTLELADYVDAGISHGFDGQALFSQDVFRSAPNDPASTVPDATNTVPYIGAQNWKADPVLLARASDLARKAKARLADSELLELALDRRDHFVGSNEWGVTGAVSEGGEPIIANDPHLSLGIPSTFYEFHLVVADDPTAGPLNVHGVGFPGSPGVILGQNEHITWGATTNPMDVSDTFLDHAEVFTPNCLLLGALACILSDGVYHPVDIEFASYFANIVGDNVQDNVVAVPLPLEQTVIATVPFRSFGPVLSITDPGVLTMGGITTALVLQYTGFHATQELQTFQQWARAQDLDEFLAGLANFDVGSQNWAYADDQGNLAYFTSAEMPLRKDLEMGTVDGVPPFFIRNGLGPNNWVPDPALSQGQRIPYAILPFDEMPQTVNPANGFFVNANNDPAGTSLDNNPLNQVRTGKPSAIYYLNPGYANGFRAGRITRLIEQEIAGDGTVSPADMRRFQGNTQQLDAEQLVPFLLDAFANAGAGGAPSELSALASDPGVAEAVGRLAAWDFSTPTGIPEGYDAADKDGVRKSNVPAPEAAASVAATLYNMWRGKALRNIIDARLAEFGLGAGSTEALKALQHLLESTPYTGVGASGVDFIPEPAALGAAERRDLALLQALRDALDTLASAEFAPAFAESTDQDDYRWGKLHRKTFNHPINPGFSIPPLAGFDDLGPGLPGLSRDGGYEVVNASGFSARSVNLNSFRFGGGPVRRYVGKGVGSGIKGDNVTPGGPSGNPFSPDYATQLGTWLTADHHKVEMRLDKIKNPQVQTLEPAP